jgi:glucose-6-phosphate 1-dehydrogenase
MHVPNDTPTILVVFGATGDLMERKIAPALYRLREKGQLSSRFRCVGMARRDIGDARFREDVGESVRARHGAEVGTDRLSAFLEDFSYSQGSFDDVGAYGRLLDVLNGIDDQWQVCANKLFYLAVPPEYYRTILEHLAASGLTAPCGGDGGWTRVLVEKPFGRDGATAQELDELLGTLFDESQIYRIDHYLAKEMLQGILAFRFSNNLLEPSWDARAIERIEITLTESLTAEGRGAFYDGVGALRDVGQNHLLQMLALITMARPAAYDADAIRAQRVAALKALAPLTREQVTARTFRAQYDGYRDVEGVAPGSETETFFRVETTLDSADWAGVPVVLTGGKALASPRKDIVVTFRSPDPCMCPDDSPLSNKVVFTLEPTESITITFWTKRPGLTAELEERDFDFFLYEKEEKTQYVEEYARLLTDAFAGDQTLFVSTREVRAMWAFIDPIVSAWADGAVPLAGYAPGSDDVVETASQGHSAAVAPAPGRTREIGLVGLGKMGAGLARNLLDHGWRVVGWNRSPAAARALETEGLVVAGSLADIASSLAAPRTVWLMVPADGAVDEVLFGGGGLADLLEPGDTVIDGGNSRYADGPRRAERLAKQGIRFLDVGVSGGPAGARTGACLMVGGEREDFERHRDLWTAVTVDDGFRFFPGAGAGHFVKMIHNGIEYGMMQAIAEGFTVLRASGYALDLTEAAAVYDRGSVIESRLVDWLRRAFTLHGEDLEGVSGSVAQTGEGAWTVDAANELGVRARVIEEAVRFRVESEADPDWTGRVLSALRQQFGGHSTG